MDTDTKWKYAIVGSGAFLVVLSIVYVVVASYYHVPVSSLLPVSQIKKNLPKTAPSYSPTGSVRRFTMGNGNPIYVVTGKFVSKPGYNQEDMLEGEFVIDGDPAETRILVAMSAKTGQITVSRFQGGFEGETKTGPEDTENLNNSILVDAPVELRLYSLGLEKSAQEEAEQKVMDDIIAGNWTIPGGFVLHPSLVGVIQ